MTVSIRNFFAAATGILLAGGAACAEDPGPPKLLIGHESEAKSFLHAFLAPRMAARLGDDPAGRAADPADSAAKAWMQDTGASSRVGRSAISAATSALQNYALEKLNVDAWSIPLLHKGSAEDNGGPAGATGPRLRFGIAHMSPRAEVVMPAGDGRFAFSADLRGNLAASFETSGAKLRLAASVDIQGRNSGVTLSKRF
jgi:hypothetical protein